VDAGDGLMLTRERLLAGRPLRQETVTIAGWGEVRLQELTHAQFVSWARECLPDGKTPDPQYGPKLLVYSIVGEDGMPLLTSADVERVAQWPASVVTALVEAAQRLNGFAGPGETAKNSGSA